MNNQDAHLRIAHTGGDSHQLTAIHTDKFKTVTLAWYHERTLDEEAAVYALAVRLMVRAFGGLDPMGVNRRLQGLYGAYLQADAVKYGDKQSLQLKLTFVHEGHLPHAINAEAVQCFAELFSAPVTEFAGFDQLVSLEKGNLLAAIAQREQDKSAMAYDQLLENLFPAQAYGATPYGKAESVKAIQGEQVRMAIENMLASRPFSLMAIGELEDQSVKNAIVASFGGFAPNAITTESRSRSTAPDTRALENREWSMQQEVEQAKLTLAYGIGPLSVAKDHYAAMLLGHMLGGGPSALLFQDLREARGLCYAIHARVDKFLGLMTVHVGLKVDKLSETRSAVEAHLMGLRSQGATASQGASATRVALTAALALSKKMLAASYASLADSPVGLMNFERSQWLAGLPEELTEVVELLYSVTLEDVMAIADKVKPVGSYVLLPKEKP